MTMICDEQGNEWRPIRDYPPPDDVPIWTAIYDKKGGWRNEQELIRSRRLWFMPDMAMYVYYTPTHWRPKLTAKQIEKQRKKAAMEASLPALPPLPEEATNDE